MNKDPYSLNNLHDIFIPAPPSLWPPGTGGLILLGIMLLSLIFAGFYYYARWKKNSYRRAGLLLLNDAVTLHDVSILLKRVALAGFPREEVASLYGRKWISFLNKTCSRADFKDRFFEDMGQTASPASIVSANIWIKRHKTLNHRQHGR